MEQNKYSMEHFKMKFFKPTLDRECITKFTEYYQMQAFILQIPFRRYTSVSTYKLSLVNNLLGLSDIYIYIQ